MRSMKAVLARELGPPETMRLEDVPARAPGPGEVRVAIHFAGVSFVDVLTAGGGYQIKPPTPMIPGSEFSGVVVEAGAGVTDYALGDRLHATAFGGAFAEEIVIPAQSATRLPVNVDMAEAAVIRSSFLTAVYTLRERAKVTPGETVLILGAGGAVGIACIQVAKAYGARPIASASTAEKRDLALANGAAAAVDSNADDWRDQIKALTDGRGVDVVVDPLGGAQTERAFRSLGWNGRHMVVGFAAGEIPRLPVNLALIKGASLVGVDLRQFGQKEPEVFRGAAAEVARLTAERIARPPIGRMLPLESFAEAMNLAAAGTLAGRVVLQMPAAG
jgi:NADPH2:quinone reductase